MDIEVVKMSSKGQIVLPLSVRNRLKLSKGEKLILVGEKDKLVLHPVKDMSPAEFAEELRIMRLAAAGWSDIEQGKYKRMSESEFKKELRSWLGLSSTRKSLRKPSAI